MAEEFEWTFPSLRVNVRAPLLASIRSEPLRPTVRKLNTLATIAQRSDDIEVSLRPNEVETDHHHDHTSDKVEVIRHVLVDIEEQVQVIPMTLAIGRRSTRSIIIDIEVVLESDDR